MNNFQFMNAELLMIMAKITWLAILKEMNFL